MVALTAARTGVARLRDKQERVRVFEAGRVYSRKDCGYDQRMRLGGLAYGAALPEQWGEATRAVDVFDIKGDLAALVAPRTLTTERAEYPFLHPGRSARVLLDGCEVGWLGEQHPRIVREIDFPRAPILFELDLEPLALRSLPVAKPVSRLPVVRRDMAVVLPEGIPAQAVLGELDVAKPPHVESIRLFDVYRGHGIDHGKKSLAFLVLMQDTERTLTDVEIEATMAGLLRVVAERFGGTLRH